jgi:hypothetical protein
MMTDPGIVDGIVYHATADRIQVDVPHQFQQIAVTINSKTL